MLLSLAGPRPATAAEPAFPQLTGRVVDTANLLSAEEERALTIDLEALEAKTTDQLVVATVPSLQGLPLEDFANRLFRAWGIGQKGKDNGVLLVVAPNERKVRIEVGYGLEGTLPDAIAKLIIENAILPRFKAGDYPGGIKAGVRDVIAVLTGDADAVKQRSRQRPDAGDRGIDIVIVIFWALIIGIWIWNIVRGFSDDAKGGRRSPGSVWTSDTSSSSWDGGGGFSGGGGSSGGGGASGSW